MKLANLFVNSGRADDWMCCACGARNPVEADSCGACGKRRWEQLGLNAMDVEVLLERAIERERKEDRRA